MSALVELETTQNLIDHDEEHLLSAHLLAIEKLPLYPQILTFLKASEIIQVNQIIDLTLNELAEMLEVEPEVAEYIFSQLENHIPPDCQFIYPFLPTKCFDKPIALLQLSETLEQELTEQKLETLAQLSVQSVAKMGSQSFVIRQAFSRYIHVFRRTSRLDPSENEQAEIRVEVNRDYTAADAFFKSESHEKPVDDAKLTIVEEQPFIKDILPLPVINHDDILVILSQHSLLPNKVKPKDINFQALAHYLKQLWDEPLEKFSLFDATLLAQHQIQTLGELMEQIFSNNLKWLQHTKKDQQSLPPPSLQLTPILLHIRQDQQQNNLQGSFFKKLSAKLFSRSSAKS